jgi:hypothetical protein
MTVDLKLMMWDWRGDLVSHLGSKDRIVISELVFVENGDTHLDDIRSPCPQFSWLGMHSSTCQGGGGCAGEICLLSVTHPIVQLEGASDVYEKGCKFKEDSMLQRA